MIALRFVQRQDDGDGRSDVGEENRNQQADKPLEVAVDAIFDVCHAILEARQPMVNLLNDRFQTATRLSMVGMFIMCPSGRHRGLSGRHRGRPLQLYLTILGNGTAQGPSPTLMS